MSFLSDKSKGIITTIVIHGLAILLLILLGFTTPLPLPAEQGILINFGNSDDGMGAIEPKVEQEASLPQSSSATKPQEESPLTQDNEEAPSLPVKKKDETKKVETTKKTTTKQTETTTNKNTTETKTEKPREANKNALFPVQKTDGSTIGEGETGKPGNQGRLEGSVDSQNRIGSTGGGGDAKIGITTNLEGRTAIYLPKPEYPSQKSGIVVVEVTVDSQGNVTKAIPGVKGSTIIDSELFKAAQSAAIKTKFNVRENSQADQIGKITYVFKLQ